MKNNNISIAGALVTCNDQGLYSLNDLHKASGGERRHEPHLWLRLESTKEIIEEMSKTDTHICVSKKGGNSQGTFVNKLLLGMYASWISPKFHINVYKIFFETMEKKISQLEESNTTLQENQNRVLRSLVANDALGLDMSGFHKKVADVIKRSFVLLGKGYTLSPIEFPLNRLSGDQKKMAIDYLLANGAERVPNCVYIRIKT